MCLLAAPWYLSPSPILSQGRLSSDPATPGEDHMCGRCALTWGVRASVVWWNWCLCKFGGDWSRALSLGEGSFSEAGSFSHVPLNSYSHLLVSFLILGSCSFLFSIRSNFGCYFSSLQSSTCLLWRHQKCKTNKRRKKQAQILFTPKTTAEPSRSLSTHIVSYILIYIIYQYDFSYCDIMITHIFFNNIYCHLMSYCEQLFFVNELFFND